MRERPILFSGEMVRAILAGKKTQTRRLVDLLAFARRVRLIEPPDTRFTEDCMRGLPCPYGVPGDRLWLREEHYRFGHWEPITGVRTKGGRQKWRFVANSDEVLFDAPASFRKGRHHKDSATPAWHKRLARFMPRALSRISLEVTSVRVERLKQITEADALAEGVDPYECPGGPAAPHPVSAFIELWDRINGKRASWASSPWVWVVSFKRVSSRNASAA